MHRLSRYLEERSCPVCGSRDQSRKVYRANFDESRLDEFAFASRKLPEFMHLSLVECPECRLLYASPALTPEFLAGAYCDAAYDSGEEADYAAATYANKLPAIVARIGRRDTALEVGAGNGAFLARLKEAGFSNVIGVEPSHAAAATADASIRESIRVSVFRSDEFSPGSFDLFACFQTLEHIREPRQLCEAAFRLLRPGGTIFLVVHDQASWVTRLAGERSPIFDIEHQQLFTRASLRYLLESCGFEQIEITTLRNRYPLGYWIRLLPLWSPLKRVLTAALRLAGLSKLPMSMNVGNLSAIGFKRPS
jgi:SAM-dependent methyltransferase